MVSMFKLAPETRMMGLGIVSALAIAFAASASTGEDSGPPGESDPRPVEPGTLEDIYGDSDAM